MDLVICTYNRADDLDRCLTQLARQTADPATWCVTVIDNNCTDHTATVVERHAAAGHLPGLVRIREARQGLTPARQRGVTEARADWVAFVDDDCLLDPGWVDNLRWHLAAAGAGMGAIGGRVVVNWGRRPPRHLASNGWLFAEQDHGDAARPVGSLVGAGLVVSRPALASIGWLDKPLLADRVGRGFVSGGDVEISLRLASAGYELRYVPDLKLRHVVERSRQALRPVLGLAAGLGGSAVLAALLQSPDAGAFVGRERQALAAETERHRRSLLQVARGRYGMRDWAVRAAFLAGRRRKLDELAAAPATLQALAGLCLTGAPRK